MVFFSFMLSNQPYHEWSILASQSLFNEGDQLSVFLSRVFPIEDCSSNTFNGHLKDTHLVIFLKESPTTKLNKPIIYLPSIHFLVSLK